jgi:hypothetical protein
MSSINPSLRPRKIEKCAKRLSNKSLSPSRASFLMLDDDPNLCGGFRMCHMFMDIGLRFPVKVGENHREN